MVSPVKGIVSMWTDVPTSDESIRGGGDYAASTIAVIPGGMPGDCVTSWMASSIGSVAAEKKIALGLSYDGDLGVEVCLART
jgi:hypothetical protein